MKKLFNFSVGVFLSFTSFKVSGDAHGCSYNPSFGYMDGGLVVTNIFDTEQDIVGFFGEINADFSKCNFIKVGMSALASYSHIADFDFGPLGERTKAITVNLAVDNSRGLKTKNFLMELAIGKKYCLQSEGRLRSANCVCNHFDISLASIFVYDKFEQKYLPAKGLKKWKDSIAKDFGIGVKSSLDWSSASRNFSIVPTIGAYLQVSSKSTIEDTKENKLSIERKKYPILRASLPIVFVIYDGFNIILRPSILWTARSIKEGDSSIAGMNGKMIEDRLSGYIGVGISSSRR